MYGRIDWGTSIMAHARRREYTYDYIACRQNPQFPSEGMPLSGSSRVESFDRGLWSRGVHMSHAGGRGAPVNEVK